MIPGFVHVEGEKTVKRKKTLLSSIPLHAELTLIRFQAEPHPFSTASGRAAWRCSISLSAVYGYKLPVVF